MTKTEEKRKAARRRQRGVPDGLMSQFHGGGHLVHSNKTVDITVYQASQDNPIVSSTGSLDVVNNNDGSWTITSEGVVQELKFSDSVESVVIRKFAPTTVENLFYGCYNLTDVDLSGLDTKDATSMMYMFAGCDLISHLDINFNTDKVQTMHGMFYGMAALTCITHLDTYPVQNKDTMFDACDNLQQPDSATRASLTSTQGLDWTNPNPCP